MQLLGIFHILVLFVKMQSPMRLAGFVLILSGIGAANEDYNVTFKYVTSYNRGGRFLTEDDLEETSVNVLKPIIFIIDGVLEKDKRDENYTEELSNAYANKLVSNVFVVNWNSNETLKNPPLNTTDSMGVEVADFIETIFNRTGEEYLDIHFVGLALGCEVAASAAKHLEKEVSRITCLDPSYYPISGETDEGKLSLQDAAFVDVIYSRTDGRNELTQTGHADFYLEGAKHCDPRDGEDGRCETLKSALLFADSVNSDDLTATKCSSLEDFKQGLCKDGEKVTFGENVSKNARGKFFLKA